MIRRGHRAMFAPLRRRRALLAAVGLAAAALVVGNCTRDELARDLGTRAVVIGIDSADWRLIEPLLAAGKLPNLARLKEQAAWGPLQTLADIPLSPVIWTSIATGKTADQHGIAWFMVDQPDGTRVPVRSTNRKAKALWNILAEHQRRPVSVGWWASYPAEDVGSGVVVSDGLGFHGFGATARSGDDGQKVYPPGRYSELAALIPPEHRVPASFVTRFLHVSPEEYHREMYTPARYRRHDVTNPIHLFQMYAATAQGLTAIAEKLLAERRYDLFMLYFEQVDSMSHLFMKYAPPKLEWVDAAEQERYRDVVSEWYVYQDELLGRILAQISLDETAVFVISDHGFKTGDRRIRSESAVDVNRAHLDHEPEGIFLAAGPHLRPGRTQTASVLDVAPTLLHYLGFPVAQDMAGRVLEEVFTPEFLRENPVRSVPSYEDETSGAKAQREDTSPVDSEQAADNLAALRTLGYIGGETSDGASGGSGQDGASSPEIHNNLGRIHLGRGDTTQARREFEKALALDPTNSDALLNLASAEAAEGRTGRAEQLVKEALAVNPNSIAALAQLAELERDQGRLDEAIRLFEEALAIDRQPFLYLGLGDVLQRAGRYEEAIAAFRSTLALDPDSALARYNLGVTYGNLNRYEDAVKEYEKALALQPAGLEAAKTLNNLGAIAQARGARDAAATFFERAAETFPLHLESRYNLAMLRLEDGEIEEAVKLLEAAAAVEPNHELVNLRLGYALLALGRGEDAYRRLLLVRRLHPKNWEAALGLAALHAGAGQEAQAQGLFTEALELGGAAAWQRAGDLPALADLRRNTARPRG
jgi:tetratricopeptide (TPR) repeat protein